MKQRTVLPRKQFPEVPIAWREAGYTAFRANAADTWDERVSEDIFDVEDEYAEVDVIVRRIREPN